MGRTAKAALIILIAGYIMSIISPEAATRELHLTAGIASVMAGHLAEVAQETTGQTETYTEALQNTSEAEYEAYMSDSTKNDANADWSASVCYLLSKIAMAEAEDQDTEGKALVICVVLNRVDSDSFPDTVEGVIFQDRQFTPISDGRWNRVEPDADCYKALDMVERGWDESQGATYFELTSSASTWHSRTLEKLFEHGDTTFYKEKDRT